MFTFETRNLDVINASRYFSSFTKVYDGAVMSTNAPYDPDGNHIRGDYGEYSIGYNSYSGYYVDYDPMVAPEERWLGYPTLMDAKRAIYRHMAPIFWIPEIPEVEEEDPEDDWDYDFTTNEWCFMGFTLSAFWDEDYHKLSIHMDDHYAVLDVDSIEEARRIVDAVISGDYTIDETPVNRYTMAGTLMLKVDMDEEIETKKGRKLRAPSREYRRNCKVRDRVPTKGTSCFRKGYHKYEKQWKEECRRTARHEAKKQCRI